MTVRLILVRHGESEANAIGIMQGRMDSPLTRKGRRQAEAVAQKLAKILVPSNVFSSPLSRALETAKIIATKFELEPVIIPELQERDLGLATGMTWEQASSLWPENAWDIKIGKPCGAWPQGETRVELQQRAHKALEKILSIQKSGTAIVVSHAGLMRALIKQIMYKHMNTDLDPKISNCSITELQITDGKYNLLCLNDTSHLELV